jgi:hypothetical protein
VHVVDAFFWRGEEWLVLADTRGNLVLEHRAAKLTERAHQMLSRLELAHGQTPRTIDAEALYLFDLQWLDTTIAMAGINDPLVLRGALYGPLGVGEIAVRHGDLTLTRADFLHAAIIQLNTLPSRHLHLCGEREEDLRAGRGVIVAYPLPPKELGWDELDNTLITDWYVYEVLAALWRDAGKDTSKLVVPEREGAVKGKGKGPKVAAPGELLALAKDTLKVVPGWPTPRVQALDARVQVATRSLASARTILMPEPQRPAALPEDWRRDFEAPPDKKQESKRAQTPNEPEWMKDFKK